MFWNVPQTWMYVTTGFVAFHRAVELDKTSFAGYSSRIANTVWICLRMLNEIPLGSWLLVHKQMKPQVLTGFDHKELLQPVDSTGSEIRIKGWFSYFCPWIKCALRLGGLDGLGTGLWKLLQQIGQIRSENSIWWFVLENLTLIWFSFFNKSIYGWILV